MRLSSHTCMYLLDMSVGANIVLSSIIACNASVKFGYAGLIIAPLICGTIIGLINGIVYIKLHISSVHLSWNIQRSEPIHMQSEVMKWLQKIWV